MACQLRHGSLELDTRAEFHGHDGYYLGEANWQKRRRRAPSIARDDILETSMGDQPRRSTEQPAVSPHRLEQLASNVHGVACAEHTEYMTFTRRILNDICELWRSTGAGECASLVVQQLEQFDSHVGGDCARSCLLQLPP